MAAVFRRRVSSILFCARLPKAGPWQLVGNAGLLTYRGSLVIAGCRRAGKSDFRGHGHRRVGRRVSTRSGEPNERHAGADDKCNCDAWSECQRLEHTNVSVSLLATDETGGSGVAQLSVSLTGAHSGD